MKIKGKPPVTRKNMPVTITWKPTKAGKDSKIIEGIVKDVIGDTVKVEYISSNFYLFRFHRSKWFSFNDQNYTVNVKE